MSASELKPGDRMVWSRPNYEGNVTVVCGPDQHDNYVITRDDDSHEYFLVVTRDELTPIPPQPEVVRVAIGLERYGKQIVAHAYTESEDGFPVEYDIWPECDILPRTEITIDPATGRVVADEPRVEKAEAQLQNMHRHVDDLTNDQIRQAIEAVVGMFPAPREAEDNKQQCRLPRDLEPTDPQWLRRAVAGGEAWASDPDLDDITLPSDEQLKEWGVKVVGFRVTRPGDRYLWGNALRVDTSVCEGACKRLIVADAEADAESDDTAARVERLETALKTIAGGMTSQFPGAPNPMQVGSPLAFRAAMWEWSQRVAQDALTAAERGAQEAEDEQ